MALTIPIKHEETYQSARTLRTSQTQTSIITAPYTAISKVKRLAQQFQQLARHMMP